MVTALPQIKVDAFGARRFEGKVAVVTGSGQGIGRAVAHRLGLEGAQVVVAERAEGPARAVTQELKDQGVDASEAIVDLSSNDGAERLADLASEQYGRIDVLVNNIGGTIRMQPFWHYRPEQIVAEIDRSLWPTVWCTHAVLKGMIERRSGVIVNIGSNAPRGIYRVPYASAKGGVFALTTSLALEVAKLGIRVNCVAPGATEVGPRPTPRSEEPMSQQERGWRDEVDGFFQHQIPMGRWGRVEEQAAAVAFMASDDASFITGQILSVAGGATVP
jgi:dihydroxycyclohexadiene carboxylate dehydrogenase